jgi:aryl-alcohol dehydrogenase-like predicted oxidoreductase
VWVWQRNDSLYDTLEALEALAAEIDTTPARYALAWTLAQPAMSSLVVGAKHSEQVADAVAATEIEIPAEHFARIDEIVPPPWHQSDPIR